MPATGELSLYFHIPFCSKKCPYCHFYVTLSEIKAQDLLAEALLLECERLLPQIEHAQIVSIYFGGGTPTLFAAKHLETVLCWIRTHLTLSPDCEITIEANPEGVTPHLAEDLASLRFNRVSLGIQSFNDTMLQNLGRTHNAAQATHAVNIMHAAGPTNLSIDLMYDLPSQTLSIWRETLNVASSLPIKHLSLYNLTLEPGTPFWRKQAAIKPLLPDDEQSLHMLDLACTLLPEANLHRYEISAFAQEGYASRHNSGYWTGRPFLGFGPSAFSYLDGRRWKNVSSLARYADLLKTDRSPVDFEEKLDAEAHLRERLAIQLRLLEGVHLTSFKVKHGPFSHDLEKTLETLEKIGYLHTQRDVLKLTARGLLFYDTVAEELILEERAKTH